jgi:Putative beta-barrel porin-2, OmpL-like. bbp2
MLPILLLTLGLSVGQTGPPSVDQPPTATATPTPPPAPPAPDRGLLMRALQGTYPGWLLDGNKISISGWCDGSFTASSDAHEQNPMGFNYRANEFLLQSNWLRIDRPVDTSATAPTFGFRSDTILPGSDYRYTIARGLFDSQLNRPNGPPNIYGIDPVQFYGEAYFPDVLRGLDVKVGRCFCLYGVESIDTTQNALSSHAYTMIYNPFTHTGVLTTLKLSDEWTMQNGLVTGSDVFIDPVATPTYAGSMKWAPPKLPDSVLFSVIVGCGRYNQSRQFNNPEVFDLVYTHKFNDRLTYSFEGLYAFQTDVPDIGTAHWFGVINYLTCQFAPRLSGTARLEFFDDAQGQRTGFVGLYSALTTGVTFKPVPWVWLRPEVRYDYNNDSSPFEGRHGLFTATMDVLVRW